VLWNEGAGRVLAAEFVNNGKTHHAVWFAQNEARGAYFDVNGRSKRRVPRSAQTRRHDGLCRC
jgi:hypothetical protein